ncbi:MAG: ArnT family glycosyltransferase [Candidatus Micrarchaeia archaeon]
MKRSKSDKIDKTSLLLLALVLLLGVILSYLLYTGPFTYYDDNYYILFAHQMLNGTFKPDAIPYSVETLTIASLAFSFLLFGYGIFQASLPSLAEYLLTAVFVFLLARKMFGKYFAALASFLFVTAPFVIGYTTRALPDLFTGLTVAIATYYLYDAINLNSKKGFFLAGFFASFTMLVKTAGLMIPALFILYFAYFAVKKRARKQVACGILGLSVPIMAMLLYFFVMTGNPLFNLHIYAGFKLLSPTTFGANLDQFNISINPIFLLYFLGMPNYGPHVYPLGLAVAIAIVGMILSIIRKELHITLFSITFMAVLLYAFFGSKSLFSYVPISVVERYFDMVAAPIAIVATYALLEFYKYIKKTNMQAARLIVALAVVFVALTNFETYTGFYYYGSGIKGYNCLFQQAVAYMSKTNSSIAVVNSQNPYLDSQYLNFVSSYKDNFSPAIGACKSSDANSLLINVFTNFDYRDEQKALSDWLGGNCTAMPITSYNFSFGKDFYEAATLYQIENASS